MTKHTPGPWGISYDDLAIDDSQMKAVWLTCEDYTYANIGQLYIRADEKEEDTANANLIAAAPDLLEALVAWSIGLATSQFRYPCRSKSSNKERQALCSRHASS